MNAPQTATATSVHQWHGRALRVVLRLAAAVALGFVGGTIGFAYFLLRWIQLRWPLNNSGLLVGYFVPGYLEFCAAGIYAVCFGLLTRRASGRVTGAVVAWLATLCAGPMIAQIAFEHVGMWELWAGAIGGLVAGTFIAIYVFISGLAEKRNKNLGPTRFSLRLLFWIVTGFAVLFGGLAITR